MVHFYAGMTDLEDFIVPLPRTELSKAIVTYSQNGITLIEKSTTTFYSIDSKQCYFLINLSQSDTLALKNDEELGIQINLITTNGQRLTSDLLLMRMGEQTHREVI